MRLKPQPSFCGNALLPLQQQAAAHHVRGREAVLETVDGLLDGKGERIGADHARIDRECGQQGAGLIERSVIRKYERGALAVQRLGGLQIQQVRFGVGLQLLVVLAHHGVVSLARNNKQAPDAVFGGSHIGDGLLHQALSILYGER